MSSSAGKTSLILGSFLLEFNKIELLRAAGLELFWLRLAAALPAFFKTATAEIYRVDK